MNQNKPYILLKLIVKTNKKTFLLEFNEHKNEAIMHTTTPPIDNACNEEIINELAKYFHTAKKNIMIIKGHRNKLKYLKIIL